MKGLDKKEIVRRLCKDIAELRAKEGYLKAGIPNYERLFGRDSCISALQLLDIQPEIAKATLEILAKYQGKTFNPKREEEPGKILHEHYVGGFWDKFRDLRKCYGKLGKVRQFIHWSYPYYGSIDSTAWFLILLSKYFAKTRDYRLVKKLWPNVKNALSWIENYGDLDRDGFIEYQRKNPYGLLHQGWKDGNSLKPIITKHPVAMVEVQGYYYLAYQEIGKLADELMGDSELKEKLERKADLLKIKFNRDFWMEDQNYFALALDGDKEKVEVITSNPGHCLFTGIIDRGKIKKVVRRLFASDMWTPYGIRTHSSEDPHFDPASYHLGSVWPFDNWIIYKGLRMCGYTKEARAIKDALISAYRALNTIPEAYGVKDNEIFLLKKVCYRQAWSSGALLNLLEE